MKHPAFMTSAEIDALVSRLTRIADGIGGYEGEEVRQAAKLITRQQLVIGWVRNAITEPKP